ncbi:MAG: peptidase inhibitor family I36 protein [Mycobacteriaceae bacterium]
MIIHTSGRRVAGMAAGALAAAALVAASAPAMAAPSPKPPQPRTSPSARIVPPIPLPSSVTSAPPSLQLRRLAFQNGAPQNGTCNVGEVCLYFLHSPIFGSLYDTSHNDPYLSNNRFISAGLGRFAHVDNNAEFVWNRDPRTSVKVCTGPNYTGTCGFVLPNQSGNFTSTYKNNVESLIWADSTN